MRGRGAGQRGQAFVELAMVIPVLIMLTVGTVDLGRAFYVNLPVAGMASTGADVGAVSNINDIGQAIRQQSNIAPNTSTAWGNVAAGGTNASCTATPNTTTNAQPCGDPYGCQTSGTNNAFTSASRIACFAVGMCTLTTTHDGKCTSAVTWQARPPAGATITSPYTNAALVVTVVYAFSPYTPLIQQFVRATGKILYISQTVTIPEQY